MHRIIVSWVKCHWCRWLCPRCEHEEPQWAVDVELEAIDWLRWEGEKLAHDAVDIDSSLLLRLRMMLKLVKNDANEDSLNAEALKVFKHAFLAIPFWIKNRKQNMQDFMFGSDRLVCRIEFHNQQAREASRLAKKRRREYSEPSRLAKKRRDQRAVADLSLETNPVAASPDEMADQRMSEEQLNHEVAASVLVEQAREVKTNVTSSCHGLLATVPASLRPT